MLIKFSSHAEAKKCVEQANGKKLPVAVNGYGVGEGEELSVVFDGEGKQLKAVLAELEGRRRQEREEKRRKEKEKEREKEKEKEKEREKEKELTAKSTPTTSASQTPSSSMPWRTALPPLAPPRPLPPGTRPPAHLPPRPQGLPPTPALNSPVPPPSHSPAPHPHPNAPPTGPRGARVRKPPASQLRSRLTGMKAVPPANIRPPIHLFPNGLAGGPVLPPHMRLGLSGRDRDDSSPFPRSRSPSPVTRRPGQFSRFNGQKERDAVMQELTKNGFEHIVIDGYGLGSVREDDVRKFVEGFSVDKVSHCRCYDFSHTHRMGY